jgi:hypothetical protein
MREPYQQFLPPMTLHYGEDDIITKRITPRIIAIAITLGAMQRCKEDLADKAKESWHELRREWLDKHQATLEELMAAAPSGSGFDSGTKLDDSSTPDKLIFTTEFHHMNQGGFYDGWTSHSIVVKPSFEFGEIIDIKGRDRNQIKDYIADVFQSFLTDLVEF